MTYPWIPAPHYTNANRGKDDVDVVVLHTMEFPETPDAAERVARYFQETTRQVSAHYNVDNNSIVQCVREEDIAWAAPGNNHNGIQIEQSGYARQAKIDWNDAYSRALLKNTARLTGEISRRYRIPLVPLGASDLRAGRRGVTTHAAVSLAWKRSNHTDPGRAYPMLRVLNMAKKMRGPLSTVLRPEKPIAKDPPILRKGDEGFQVKRAQRLLQAHGRTVEVDGIFGQNTETAVKRFQRDNSLANDGIIGPLT